MMPTVKLKPVAEQLAYLRKGAAEIIRDDELVAKLEKSHATGKPLRVKLGVDPTAPDLHLGHMVVIEKLRHFQIQGHTAIFLVGDFTARVGDPTGQSETRPPLSREQVEANAKTYLDQVYRILDRQKTEVRYNSEWLDKLTSQDIVRLCAKYRVARMLEHEDFRSRLQNNQPISMHELIYPLLVAYDSVVLEADVELGATEQKFNLLMGREIQREYGQPSQVVLTMPILVGLDGVRKMSKSLGNYVGITEPPNEMFGKTMSIPDELMWPYFELLTPLPQQEVDRFQQEVREGKTNPKTVKMVLAKWIVKDFHGEAAAENAAQHFDRIFSQRQAPDELPVRKISAGAAKRLAVLLVELELAPSKAEADRLIKAGSIELDGVPITNVRKEVDLSEPTEFTLRAGKRRFLRVIVG